jgi:hypothetical protein
VHALLYPILLLWLLHVDALWYCLQEDVALLGCCVCCPALTVAVSSIELYGRLAFPCAWVQVRICLYFCMDNSDPTLLVLVCGACSSCSSIVGSAAAQRCCFVACVAAHVCQFCISYCSYWDNAHLSSACKTSTASPLAACDRASGTA